MTYILRGNTNASSHACGWRAPRLEQKCAGNKSSVCSNFFFVKIFLLFVGCFWLGGVSKALFFLPWFPHFPMFMYRFSKAALHQLLDTLKYHQSVLHAKKQQLTSGSCFGQRFSGPVSKLKLAVYLCKHIFLTGMVVSEWQVKCCCFLCRWEQCHNSFFHTPFLLVGSIFLSLWLAYILQTCLVSTLLGIWTLLPIVSLWFCKEVAQWIVLLAMALITFAPTCTLMEDLVCLFVFSLPFYHATISGVNEGDEQSQRYLLLLVM